MQYAERTRGYLASKLEDRLGGTQYQIDVARATSLPLILDYTIRTLFDATKASGVATAESSSSNDEVVPKGGRLVVLPPRRLLHR